jgi:hypothetical protein
VTFRKTMLGAVALAALALPANAADIYTNINPMCQVNCQGSNTVTAPTTPSVDRPPMVVLPTALGWVSDRFVHCTTRGGCYINVRADGANIRKDPGGYIFMALVNGVPLVVLDQSEGWTLIAASCDLGPTGLRSDTAHGVSLQACR